jgi:ABC-2 type transport system ATP-binding protein
VRTIRCGTSLPAGLLRSIAGVTAVDTASTLTTLTTSQPEATLREMLALDPTLHSLEVTSPALEDAFLALTANA